MVKKLPKKANSYAIILDKSHKKPLRLSKETSVQVSIKDNSLIITPLNAGIGKEGLSKSIIKLRLDYENMLKNLADS